MNLISLQSGPMEAETHHLKVLQLRCIFLGAYIARHFAYSFTVSDPNFCEFISGRLRCKIMEEYTL